METRVEAGTKRRLQAVDPAQKLAQDREDAGLMRRFKKGDPSAFPKLVARHQRPVYHFCHRMLGKGPAAEDAVQEVFLRVARGAKTWTESAKFTTWLYTIARNHCVDALRKAKHRKTISLDHPLEDHDESGSFGDAIADPGAIAPDRGAHRARLRSALTKAVAGLAEEQREVFLMREIAGMQFKEIAEVVGAPENTIKSRMRYALEHLRDTLLNAGIDPELP